MKLKLINILILIFPLVSLYPQEAKDSYSSSSLLSGGEWYKIAIIEEGVYRIDYSDIVGLGLSNPSYPRIFANNKGQLPYYNGPVQVDDLEEIAIYVDAGFDNIFNEGDYLLFYGQSTSRWHYDASDDKFEFERHNYSDTAYYFITTGNSVGKAITKDESLLGIPENVSSESDLLYIHETDKENILKSGRQWYEPIYPNSVINIESSFTDLVENEPVYYEMRVIARSPSPTLFRLYEESSVQKSVEVGSMDLSYSTGTYAQIVDSTGHFYTLSSSPSFHLRFDPGGIYNARGWIDYVKLRTRKHNIYGGGRMILTDTRSVGEGRTTRFCIETATYPRLWDITDPEVPVRIEYHMSGNDLYFDQKTDTLKRFIIFDNESLLRPIFNAARVPLQNLHGSPPVDMIIVTHPLFRSYAEELASLHLSHSGITSNIVTPEEIYNEFSGGISDIVAIRNYIRMVYEKQTGTDTPLRYLLLFGDGSYENRTPPPWNPNFVPTYQSENSNIVVASFVSDDFYTLLDEGEGEAHGTEDIAVGRLPVSDTTEAGIVVRKIARYLDQGEHGDWKNNICVVADDEDNNTHILNAEGIAEIIEAEDDDLIVNKVYLDSYPQINTSTGESYPAAKEEINNQINSGCLIFNYIGHGSENGLAAERVVGSDDILSWENKERLPLFITATCEFSRFDDAEMNEITKTRIEKTSAGEQVLFNENGGGIALMSTTRIVFSSQNHNLNKNIFKYAFDTDENGKPMRMGDIFRLAKLDSGDDINKRNFSLLGDPALPLALPHDGNIITDSINNININQDCDTLKALSLITISGHIEDNYDNTMTSFNGIVKPVIYDKPSITETLGNDGGTTIEYLSHKNTLFNSTCVVEDGFFSFSFIVPREIDYRYGEGRIVYYAHNDNLEMNGSCDEIIVGGFSTSAILDTVGPTIRLFINDTLFRNGGITDSDPELLAILEDPSGINSSGFAIGHDIIAFLNGEKEDYFVLNNLFETVAGDYKKGTVRYKLAGLTEGIHTITLKAWDNHNNSTIDSLNFIIVEGSRIVLENIMNYPNPVTGSTTITAQHNRPDEQLYVNIKIFDPSGRLIRILETTTANGGFQLPGILWDGNNSYGQRVARGLYIYRMDIKTGGGERVSGSGRIIIL